MDRKVLGIALRSEKNGLMREVGEGDASADGGLDGEYTAAVERGITFIASDQWDEAQRELGAELPWHTRRANILLEVGSLLGLIGKTVLIGSVRVAIGAQTHPCSLMDTIQPGLCKALDSEGRAGVYGRVIQGGRLAVGDVMKVEGL